MKKIFILFLFVSFFFSSPSVVAAKCSIDNPDTVATGSQFTVTIKNATKGYNYRLFAYKSAVLVEQKDQVASADSLNYTLGPYVGPATYNFDAGGYDSTGLKDNCTTGPPLQVTGVSQKHYDCRNSGTPQAACVENPNGAFPSVESCICPKTNPPPILPPPPPNPGPGTNQNGTGLPNPSDWLPKLNPGNGFFSGDINFVTGKIIPLFVSLLLFLLILLSLIFILIGGIKWITSGGDKEGMAKAKGTVTYAIIGLVLGLSSFIILNIISGIFNVNITGVPPKPKLTCQEQKSACYADCRNKFFSANYVLQTAKVDACLNDCNKLCTEPPGCTGNLCPI